MNEELPGEHILEEYGEIIDRARVTPTMDLWEALNLIADDLPYKQPSDTECMVLENCFDLVERLINMDRKFNVITQVDPAFKRSLSKYLSYFDSKAIKTLTKKNCLKELK